MRDVLCMLTLPYLVIDSKPANERSIWELYNEMAESEDSIRESDWSDLADTILVFVSSVISSLRQSGNSSAGRAIRRFSFGLPYLHNRITSTR